MLSILILKAFFDDDTYDNDEEGFEEFGFVAEYFEFFLFEEEETVGCADFLGFGIDSCDFWVDEFGHDDFTVLGEEYLRSV